MSEKQTVRRCIGSARFGIDPHDAPVTDFPTQPSQKDGLGRMCRAHWNEYTKGLARDARARKAAETGEPAASPEAKEKPARAVRRKAAEEIAEETAPS